MTSSPFSGAVATTFDLLATPSPVAIQPRKTASRISQNSCENVLTTGVRATHFPNPVTKSKERNAKMAQIARDASSRIDVAPARALSRLGRRAVTPILGLAFLFLSLVADRIDIRPLRRALNWLALQASSPAIPSRAASSVAMHRRNLASLLTEYWYGESRVIGVERVFGQAPTDRYVARAFLAGLAARFEEAGLPTWPIDPRQPRAIDNLLETGDGVYKVVDLESGLVSPLPSLKTWFRALRRGLAPFSDVVFFDVTRAYIAREEERMRAKLGNAWVEDLNATLDAAESETVARRRGEPRLSNRLLSGVITGFGIRTWRTRLQSRAAGGRVKAQAWLERAVATWEREERITAEEAATLRAQMAEPSFQATLPYLGAHLLISIPLRFPFGSMIRPFLILGALAVATVRLLARRTDRESWRRAATIHSPLVLLLSAMPAVGSMAYLAAKPMRSNRLLPRIVADTLAQKVPWNLYTRSGLRRLIARPTPFERLGTSRAAGDAGPIRQLRWASSDHRTSNVVTETASDSTLPVPLCRPTPVVLSSSPQPRAA